jgi:tRNA-modifying protein YgfZ
MDPTFNLDYDALSTGAGLVDVSGRTQIEATGDDRAAFLHNLTTAPIRSLVPGKGCEAFVLDVRGHTLGHVLVFCTPKSLVIDSVAGENGRLLAHFERYHIRERVEFHDRTDAWGEILLAGAQSPAILESLVGTAAAQIFGERLSHAQAELAGHTVWLRNVDLAGPHCALISAPRESIPPVADSLARAGARRCGASALEAVRIEAGWPIFGIDITDKNLPQEVGRTALAISFTKGCYLGQETVARIDALGHVNKMLCGVRFLAPDQKIPSAGLELLSGDAVVGAVMSACFSPRLSAPLALAYLRRGSTAPGTKLTSACGEAEVVTLPVSDPKEPRTK